MDENDRYTHIVILQPECMSGKPQFIESEEDWIIWILGEDQGRRLALGDLSSRMERAPDHVLPMLRILKRRGAVTLADHVGGNETEVGLAPIGTAIYTKLKGLASSSKNTKKYA